MVRVAALYDIHGNASALSAVLADHRLATADLIVCGGDVVAGPQPELCLDLLEHAPIPVRFIRGNGERECVDQAAQDSESGVEGALPRRRVDAVAAWPLVTEVEVEGLGHVLFCHATPASDKQIITRATPSAVARSLLGPVTAPVVVCGHTHVQFDRDLGGLRLVNAGSVGLPYEGSPDARWTLLGPTVDALSTPYDAASALATIERLPRTWFTDLFAQVARGEITAQGATDELEARRLGTET